MVFLWLVYVTLQCTIGFPFILGLNNTPHNTVCVYIYHILSIYSSISGHPTLWLFSSAAMIMGVQIFHWDPDFNSFWFTLSGIAVSYDSSVFNFGGTSTLISIRLYYFTIPPIVCKSSNFFMSLLILVILCFFDSSHSDESE